MPVTIALPPMLEAIAGNISQFVTTGDTIGACLQKLAAQYPAIGSKVLNGDKLANGVSIFLNAQNVPKNVLQQPVRDGDQIHISFIVLGG